MRNFSSILFFRPIITSTVFFLYIRKYILFRIKMAGSTKEAFFAKGPFLFLLVAAVVASHIHCGVGADMEMDASPAAIPGGSMSGECRNKPDGIYPNPMNCTMFFACSGEATHVMHCNEGLVFDTDSQRCEWPETAKANCISVQAPVPAEPVTDEAPPTTPIPDTAEESTNPPKPEAPPKPRMVEFKKMEELNPEMDNPVVGGEKGENVSLYICRAVLHPDPGVVLPGQTDLTSGVCIVPDDEDSSPQQFKAFEVLVNPTEVPLDWELVTNLKKLPPTAVVGGKFLSSNFYSFYVGRCRVKVTGAGGDQELLLPGSISYNPFTLAYEAAVATENRNYLCVKNFEVLVYK